MKKLLLGLAMLFVASTQAYAQSNATSANSLTNIAMWCLNSGGTAWIPAQDTVHCAGSGGGGGTVNGGGTAGTPNAGVLSIQGIASMTPVQTTINSGTNVIGKVDTDATNATSTLTLTSTTTAYTAGNLIANNATAGSITVPSFTMTNVTGIIQRLRLSTNDTVSTSWGAQTITVDLWSAAPTFTNGDRGAYSPATGTASHLGQFSCVMSAIYGDGAYAECAPVVGNFELLKLSGTSVYWTLTAKTGSGVTGASKVFTLTAEVLN